MTTWLFPLLMAGLVFQPQVAVAVHDDPPPVVASRSWCGIYPTVLVPWTCDGQVDAPALIRQLEHLLCHRVNGLLILGTLGEGEYVDAAERATVISISVSTAKRQVPVVVGIHTADVNVALEQMKQAKELGADAVLVKYTGCPGTPFCLVLGFYHALSQSNLLPIFIYYYPSQTGLTFSPEEIAALLHLPGVAGIKESILDLRHIERQIALTRDVQPTFLSGTALNLTQFAEIGGHGAMCAEALILPAKTMAAYEAAYELGDRQSARALQKELFLVAPLIQRIPVSPGGARLITMASQDLHLRQRIGSESTSAKLKRALDELGINMLPIVKPPQRQLTPLEKLQVRMLMPRLRRAQ